MRKCRWNGGRDSHRVLRTAVACAHMPHSVGHGLTVSCFKASTLAATLQLYSSTAIQQYTPFISGFREGQASLGHLWAGPGGGAVHAWQGAVPAAVRQGLCERV